MAKSRHMGTWLYVNIGSGNDPLPAGTKLLPEPMLIHHQMSSEALTLD